MSALNLRDFYPGKRLSFEGSLCTVCYVGEVQHTKGQWLGVEWDEPDRGKHTGTLKGIEYFKCRSRYGNPASFIRPTRLPDKPLNFLEALRKKYASDSEEPSKIHANEISGKIVEEVGFDKIRRQLAELQKLKIVLLDGLCLAGLKTSDAKSAIGNEELQRCTDEVVATCPEIQQLDLSRNLLESFLDVQYICKALPNLKSLSLEGNRFIYDPMIFNKTSTLAAFGGITSLNLDSTLLSWPDIVELTSHFPSLTNLSVKSNELVAIKEPLKTASLQELTLTSNFFRSFSDLASLSDLPSLSSLVLRLNPISTLYWPGESSALIFPTIQALDLSSAEITDINVLSHLPSLFPALNSLRTSKNPVYDRLSTEESFILTLARIPKLETLNYSKVTPAERTNAELYYLSRIGKELSAAPEGQQATVLAKNPRYAELCALHGEPAIDRAAALAVANQNNLASRQISISFTLVPDHKTESLKIPRSVNVYRLKAIAGILFDLPPTHLRLIWETEEFDPVARNLHVGADGGGREDEWSVESASDEEDEKAEGEKNSASRAGAREEGKWVRREVELVDGTRDVGFWIDVKAAKVRVEVRGPLRIE